LCDSHAKGPRAQRDAGEHRERERDERAHSGRVREDPDDVGAQGHDRLVRVSAAVLVLVSELRVVVVRVVVTVVAVDPSPG